MLFKIVVIFVTILFIIILVVKRFVYFFPSYEFMAPKINYEDIYEGKLHAWYTEGQKGINGKVFLFCHGNAGNISHRQDKLIEMAKLGHSVLIFDYSGFGRSKGIPNEDMCYSNVDMFFDHLLRRGYKRENIVPYGESLGASIASYIARKYNLPVVVIESGLTSMKDMVKIHAPRFLKFIYPLFPEFDTIKYLTGYKGKILTIYSKSDEIIHYNVAQKLIEMSTNHIEINGDHNNPQITQEIWRKVHEFIG